MHPRARAPPCSYCRRFATALVQELQRETGAQPRRLARPCSSGTGVGARMWGRRAGYSGGGPNQQRGIERGSGCTQWSGVAGCVVFSFGVQFSRYLRQPCVCLRLSNVTPHLHPARPRSFPPLPWAVYWRPAPSLTCSAHRWMVHLTRLSLLPCWSSSPSSSSFYIPPRQLFFFSAYTCAYLRARLRQTSRVAPSTLAMAPGLSWPNAHSRGRATGFISARSRVPISRCRIASSWTPNSQGALILPAPARPVQRTHTPATRPTACAAFLVEMAQREAPS